VPGRIRPVATVHGPAACHARPTGRPIGPRPGGPVQLRGGSRAARAPGAPTAWSSRVGRRGGTQAAWSPRAGRRGGASPTARRWLADGNVLPASSWGPPRGRRATRAEAGLTQTAARRWGGEAWRSCRRRGPCPTPRGEREEREVGIKEGRRGAG
jgi:hypothetical protein